MQIRRLTPGDEDELYTFYRNLTEAVAALFRPFEPLNPEVIRKHLADADAGEDISLGLTAKHGIVGHGFVMRIADRNPIFGIGIDETYHGEGYGSRLAREVIQRCDAAGIENISLTVLKRNQKAIRMYRRLGFRAITDHTYLYEHDSLLMIRKDLL